MPPVRFSRASTRFKLIFGGSDEATEAAAPPPRPNPPLVVGGGRGVRTRAAPPPAPDPGCRGLGPRRGGEEDPCQGRAHLYRPPRATEGQARGGDRAG